MPRGKKPPDPLLEADVDLLEYLPLLKAYVGGASVDEDATFHELSAAQIASIAQATVEQARAFLPNGKITEYRKRAQTLKENCVAEECFVAGIRLSMHRLAPLLRNEQDILDEITCDIEQNFEAIRREAAKQCSAILQEITDFAARKGRKGRPTGAKPKSLETILDHEILVEVVNRIAPSLRTSKDAISQHIPVIVREYVRLGQLSAKGETLQDCVDIHSERLRRLLDNLEAKSVSYRGFSIKRRDT